jgi:uncharacterized membrane protein YfcA
MALGLALSVAIGVVLGLVGGGGSILTVPLFVYGFGLAPKEAIATSLAVVAAASAAAAVQYARRGDVRIGTALPFGAAGMAGAYAGGRAAALFDGALLLLLFASMMLLTAIAMWRGRREATVPAPAAHVTARLAAQGLAVGLFTGLVGAGGGFLIVPALVLWAGLSIRCAVGTSLIVIVMNSVAGFVGYASHVAVQPALAAAVAIATIAGSFAGARLAPRVDPIHLRKGFAVFVAAMAVFVLVREAETWLATARAALPASAAQLAFALVMLGVGIAAGRASARAGGDSITEAELGYEQGGGI